MTMEMPCVVLSSGLIVHNFSSPHEFRFDDGSVLPPCSAERASRLMLHKETDIVPNERFPDVEDVRVSFKMSTIVQKELYQAQDIDGIVLVPLPVLQLARDRYEDSPFRGCFVTDRVHKTISSTKFCV